MSDDYEFHKYREEWGEDQGTITCPGCGEDSMTIYESGDQYCAACGYHIEG